MSVTKQPDKRDGSCRVIPDKTTAPWLATRVDRQEARPLIAVPVVPGSSGSVSELSAVFSNGRLSIVCKTFEWPGRNPRSLANTSLIGFSQVIMIC